MRICFLVTSDAPKDPRVSRHASLLRDRGHEVEIVYPNRSMFELIQRRGRKLPPVVRYSLLQTVLLLDFWRRGRRFNAHLYITNDLDTLLAGVLCAGASRRLIHDAHELWPDQWIGMGVFPGPVIAWLRIFERVLICRAEAVITVNEFIADVLRSRYGIRRLSVVMNLPDASARASQPSKRTALYHGAYVANRGLENLVLSCAFLQKDVTLVLRGYGELENKLRQLGRPYDNVRFEKPVPMAQLVRKAAEASVGVVPYLPTNLNNYYASPNKLFEYIRAGIPVVGSDIPFLRKVIVGENIGCIFNPYDPRSIALAINRATGTDLLPVFRRSVRRVQDKYSWEHESKKLVMLVERKV
jgi:glycogen(starch) synthase